MSVPDILYYGCYGESGHHFWTEDLFLNPRWAMVTKEIPWGTEVDGGLCPRGRQVQGLALLHQKDGWTALAFWDRSVDSRPGSHSAFLVRQTLDFEAMVAVCKETFPRVWDRYTFEVVTSDV